MVASGIPPGAWTVDRPLYPATFPELSVQAIFSRRDLTVSGNSCSLPCVWVAASMAGRETLPRKRERGCCSGTEDVFSEIDVASGAAIGEAELLTPTLSPGGAVSVMRLLQARGEGAPSLPKNAPARLKNGLSRVARANGTGGAAYYGLFQPGSSVVERLEVCPCLRGQEARARAKRRRPGRPVQPAGLEPGGRYEVAWGESANPRKADASKSQAPQGRHRFPNVLGLPCAAPPGLGILGRGLIPGVRQPSPQAISCRPPGSDPELRVPKEPNDIPWFPRVGVPSPLVCSRSITEPSPPGERVRVRGFWAGAPSPLACPHNAVRSSPQGSKEISPCN